jgi:hypothetical protein
MSLACPDIAEMAPELVLGVLDGPHRAAALGHLDTCASCRQTVEELTETAEKLFGLAPEADPPLGFETRVMARLQPARPPRRRRVVAAIVVSALLASAVTAVVIDRRHAMNARFTHEYVAALRVLGGRSLHAAELRDTNGRRAGEVFLYDGHPSWWFVSLDKPGAGPIVLELEFTGGRSTRSAPLAPTAAINSWGMRTDEALGNATAVRLLGPNGTVEYRTDRLST